MISLNYLRFYLLNERHPSPPLFFIVIIMKDLLSDFSDYHSILYFLALFLVLTKQYNILYMLPSCIYSPNSHQATLFFLFSALSCTKKWKVYLFIYTLAETYLIFRSQSTDFIWVLPAAMCIIIYKNLIFQTTEENIQYFIGFFIMCVFNLILTFANSIKIKLKIFSLLLVLCISALLSHRIINNELKKLRQMQIQNIKNPEMMARYINLLLEDLKQEAVTSAKLSIHSQKCRNINCYCKNNKDSKEFYVRQMLQNFMRSLGSLGDTYLWEYYIDFYLKKDQVMIAYFNLLKWRPNSYFSLMSKLKTEAKIIKFLEKANNKIPYYKQYIYGLQYDKQCQYLSLQIHQILKLKIHFWKEVAKENLSLQKLQSLGLSIISRMQQLNHFYNCTIKQYQKYLFCFESTLLYGIYLIFSTNFKEYADSLIKNISKIIQKGSINSANTSQTYVIKAVVQNSEKFMTRQNVRSFQNQKEISTLLKLQQMHRNEFKLIIDAVSFGFCRMVNIPKHLIIGCQLNSLIPNCYKQIHNVRLAQILDFNSDTVKQLVPPKILHSELVLLFKGAQNQLFAGLICIKYNMDIDKGVTFLSIVKRPSQKKCIALATLSGVLMQKQKGFPPEIIKHREVKKYFAKLKAGWLKNRIIQEQKFNLSINRISYEVTIDSPYAYLLTDKECLNNTQPPIHIQLLDEESAKNRYKQEIQGHNYVKDQITKIEKLIIEQNQTSVGSSLQTKSSNKSISAVNIISNFWQNNSLPVYKYIIITFSIVLLCNIVLNLIINIKLILPWDNVSAVNNPIIDLVNLYNIQILQSKAVLNLQDSINYQKYQYMLNQSRISKYYTGKPFPIQIKIIFGNIALQLWSAVAGLWVDYSAILWPYIQARLQQNIEVNQLINAANYTNSKTHYLTYGQIIFNFAVDNILIIYQNNYQGLLFPHLLTQVQNQTSNLAQFQAIVSESFRSSITNQIVLGIVFTVLILIFIIPMCFVLRMRSQAHSRVFDLLTSIDCQSITHQIQSLLYISNILNNYKEYQQKFNFQLLNQQTSFLDIKDSKKIIEGESSALKEIIMGKDSLHMRSRRKSIISTISGSKSGKKNDSQKNLLKILKDNGWQEDETSQMFRNIKTEIYGQMSKLGELKGRKRSGELDSSGSEHDKNKHITFKHCTIYLLLLSFILFICSSMLINIQYINYSQNAEIQISNFYKQVLKFNMKLTKIKIYLWEGGNSYKTKYDVADQRIMLQQMLGKTLNYTIINNDQVDSPAPTTSGFVKISQSNPSLRMIQSEITSIIYNLVQFRYNLQKDSYFASNGTLSNSSQYKNLYQQLFYLQSLNNQRQILVKKMTNNIKEDMFQHCQKARQQKKLILTVLLIWSLISYVLGLVLIYQMKHKYFKQVCILTFLNDEMLSKNKRVQSYLENLSKNTYY